MQMTLPEIIMASTILTWIVLTTVYRFRSNNKIMKELHEIKDLIQYKNNSVRTTDDSKEFTTESQRNDCVN